MAWVQAVGPSLGGRVAIGLELRIVPGQHVLDLREGEPAGHVPVPPLERRTAGIVATNASYTTPRDAILERSVRQPAAAWPRSPRPNASSLPFSRPPPGAKPSLGGDHFQGADHACPDGSRIALFLLACFFF